MDETIIGTFDDVKFIQGVTFLTQKNWQDYFSNVIKNGVYEGLEPRNYVGDSVYSNGRTFITDGTVFANGISATIKTGSGYTDIGTCPSGKKDRLICVRVYFEENIAELIQKTDVMEIPESQTIYSDTYKLFSGYTMDLLAHDESYLMERNASFWDIPIFYQGASDLEYTAKGLDLRRVITNIRQNDPENTIYKGGYENKYKVSGNNVYHFKVTEDNKEYCFCADPIDLPDGAIIIIDRMQAPTGSTTKIIFSTAAATNDNLASSSYYFNGTYPYIDTDNNSLDKDLTTEDIFCLQITYVGTKGTYEINDHIRCYPLDFRVHMLPESWI